MHNGIRWIWAGVGAVILIGLVGFFTWQSGKALLPEDNRLTVGATIFPLADIIKQVGGDDVRVIQVIPAGVTEHSLDITPQQIAALDKARLLFRIGQGLDNHLTDKIVGTLPPLTVKDVDAGITRREFTLEELAAEAAEHAAEEEEDHDSGIDPHYWLTVPNGIQIAHTVADSLKDIDPEHAAAYETRLTGYINELSVLEQELQQQAKAVPVKQFISMHNAWGYMARHYGFELVATYEPVEGQEPSAADLQELKNTISRYGIKTFYAEPQKSSSSEVGFLHREFGLKISTLDPVGGLDDKNSYVDLMRANIEALVKGGM